MKHRGIVILFMGMVAACQVDASDPGIDSFEQAEICDDCPGDGGGGGGLDPWCSEACTSAADCDQTCRRPNGVVTTCGALSTPTQRTCRTCVAACSSTGSCYETCRSTSGAITTCGVINQCRKYDVYCAYPTLTDQVVSDINESGAGGPFAYMYFGSAAPQTKSGDVPSQLGGHPYTPSSFWASNFRGPHQMYGESARYQWEWYDDPPSGKSMSWGDYGTPFKYGQQCISVTKNSAAPALTVKTEAVYEDDECIGPICNPDDFVGSFTIDRANCNHQVFGSGALTGWTSELAATVNNDLATVNYRLWCYSCKDAWSPSCTAGVVP
jgi:hypothetical protein